MSRLTPNQQHTLLALLAEVTDDLLPMPRLVHATPGTDAWLHYRALVRTGHLQSTGVLGALGEGFIITAKGEAAADAHADGLVAHWTRLTAEAASDPLLTCIERARLMLRYEIRAAMAQAHLARMAAAYAAAGALATTSTEAAACLH